MELLYFYLNCISSEKHLTRHLNVIKIVCILQNSLSVSPKSFCTCITIEKKRQNISGLRVFYKGNKAQDERKNPLKSSRKKTVKENCAFITR